MIDDVAVGVVGEKPVFSVEPGDLAGTYISPLILAYDWSNRLRFAFKAPLIPQYIVDEIVKIEKMKGIKVEVRKLKWGQESEILINGKVVMKTADTDPDLSPYDRARRIAQRIEESIIEGHDKDNISIEIMPGGYYGVMIGNTAVSLVSRQDAEARETKLWNLAVEYVNNIRGALGIKTVPLRGVRGFLSQIGRASWYGGIFHGRRTSSGERYNMYGLTAAHRTLPFGTTVLVTRLDNYKSVAVRITDRGPYLGGRIIDLSRSAAEQLGMLKRGIAQVKIEVLDKPAEKKK
ncbi:MAG: septal ring lytic transglycosylase RlpA family protein [Candidatus Margulisiibacteriota bacterium]